MAQKPLRFGSAKMATIKGSFTGAANEESCTEVSIAGQNSMGRKATSKLAVSH